ncbi:MAG: YkgJ family cysteine cluster protein [Anaerolineales bacterium]
MRRENPCLTCGACCAFARVSFYWGEADDAPGGTVPAALTEDITPFYRAMRGTNQKQPRCIALHGVVGQAAHCTIYEKRPSPCRGFGIQFIDGKVLATPDELAHCNHARAIHGLPPIEADAWLEET